MNSQTIEPAMLFAFRQHLEAKEREESTIEKYLRDMRLFLRWLPDKAVTAEAVTCWKNHMRTAGYKPETINSKLSSLEAVPIGEK